MSRAVRLLKLRWILGFLALALLSLGNHRAFALRQTNAGSVDAQPVNVGMVALLAATERYEGKFIRTHGFLCIEFEGNALYLHREDYRYGLTKNSFALRLTEAQRKTFKGLSLKYVLIEGTVYASGLERDDSGGAIGDITRLEAWPIDRESAPHK